MENNPNSKTGLFIRLTLVLAMFITGAALYSQLPDPLPTHFDFSGQPDSFGAKWWAVWIVPVVGLLLTILFPIISRIDPRYKNYKKFSGAWEVIQTAIIGFFAYLYAITLLISLNPDLQPLMGRFMFVGIGLMFIVLGNVMGKVRWNYFVGLKTPWALDDPEVWQKSQRFAGWAFVLGGLAFLFEAWWYQYLGWFFGLTIAGVVVVPMVYSYLVSRKK
jgi:uncharacterized membrane protein